MQSLFDIAVVGRLGRYRWRLAIGSLLGLVGSATLVPTAPVQCGAHVTVPATGGRGHRRLYDLALGWSSSLHRRRRRRRSLLAMHHRGGLLRMTWARRRLWSRLPATAGCAACRTPCDRCGVVASVVEFASPLLLTVIAVPAGVNRSAVANWWGWLAPLLPVRYCRAGVAVPDCAVLGAQLMMAQPIVRTLAFQVCYVLAPRRWPSLAASSWPTRSCVAVRSSALVLIR